MTANALVVLFVLLGAVAHADIPEVDARVLAVPCAAAKALDGCPTCTCRLRTQSSPDTGIAPALLTTPIAALIDVEGTRADGAYAAVHVIMGNGERLEHVGRLAESRQVNAAAGAMYVQLAVTSGRQVFQTCARCEHPAVGLVHPFELTTTLSTMDGTTFQERVVEETRAVVCFDQDARPVCATIAVRFEERLTEPAMAPGMRTKVLSRAGFQRTWKLGARGDLVLGAASGKLATRLTQPKAQSIPLTLLASHPEATLLTR